MRVKHWKHSKSGGWDSHTSTSSEKETRPATRRRVQLEVDASTFVTMTSKAIDTDVFETNPYEDHPSLTTLEADVLWEYAKLSQHVKIVGNSWFHLIHHKLTTKRVKLVAKTRQLSEEPDKTLLNQLRVLETKMGLVMTLVGGKTVDREKICVTESFDSSKHRCGVLSMSNLCQKLLHLSTSHPIQQSEDNSPSTCHYKHSFLLYCIFTPLVCIHNKSGPKRAHSSRKATHGRYVPNDQLPVRAAGAHLRHIVPRPFERPDTGDRVLMDGQQLRLRACARARHTGCACAPTYVGIAECVERRAIEAADCGATPSVG